MPVAKTTKPISQTVHPEFAKMLPHWVKWRMAFEGGPDFIDAYLKRYSKREIKPEFDERKAITYNPNVTGSIVCIIRNAIAAKLPEVVRKGDPRYMAMCEKNVDMKQSSMNHFLALEVLPMLLCQSKRYVCVDSPPIPEGASTAVAATVPLPYLWSASAEDCRSWKQNEETAQLEVALFSERVDVVDPETKLVTGCEGRYRYLRLLHPGEKWNGLRAPADRPVVLQRLLDKSDKDVVKPVLIDIPRLPVVEFAIAASVVKDIAQMQVALLNLASSDMSFLFRGNFPIFTKQYFAGRRSLQSMGTKRTNSLDEEVDLQDRVLESDRRNNELRTGNNTGVGYEKDLERPGFVAPPTSNLEASMKKQDGLATMMHSLLDLALVSLSVSAIEQSGKSKEADRIGKEEGLIHIAQSLEKGEREVAEIIHMFLGTEESSKIEVKYPGTFTLKTQEQRNAEAAALIANKGAARSPTFQRAMEKRAIDVLMKPIAGPAEILAAQKEVDNTDWFDDSPTRAAQLVADLTAGLLSPETGSKLRGFPEDEVAKITAAKVAQADLLSGGPVIPPEPEPTEPPAAPGTPGVKPAIETAPLTPDESNDITIAAPANRGAGFLVGAEPA